MTSLSLGSQLNHPVLWLKFSLDSRLYYEILQHLIDFLAFLNTKL